MNYYCPDCGSDSYPCECPILKEIRKVTTMTKRENIVELKPCPFCGSEPSVDSYISETCNDQHLEITCENEECDANPSVGGEHLCGNGAIEVWNTRATEYKGA